VDVSFKIHTKETPLKNELDEAWQQFDQQLRGHQGEKIVETKKILNAPQNTEQS